MIMKFTIPPATFDTELTLPSQDFQKTDTRYDEYR